MRRIVSGGQEIDCCTACGALWFDPGEVRELTEGRLAIGGEGETSPDPPGNRETGEKRGALLFRVRREAGSLACPCCEGRLTAVDFQLTGTPVVHCSNCEGILAPRASAAAIAAKFRLFREHGEKFAALGEILARREQERIEGKYGPVGQGSGVTVPLPVVVPLADDGPDLRSLPLITGAFIALSVVIYLIGQFRGAPLPLPGGLAGLPSGTGFAGVPRLPLLFAPFFHAGLLPLLAGSLFLLVLGDNVEDRMGAVPYFLFYLFCAACAGAAHVLWGKPGGPPAVGSAGAVAGILGAYLVFFPNVSIRMYGMGRILTLPAYLFASAWMVAVFFLGAGSEGPLPRLLDPAPLSLPGNLAGFGAGVAVALAWRIGEQGKGDSRPDTASG
ncbi:MAG: rhomboid family intramembrane serine protease [Deltaproteobacteria bacterium]|nr:rhomboid family intramembrane serine protease [Deltaproteobacteria bacterium]